VDIEECPSAGGPCITVPVTVSGNGVLTGSASPSSIFFGNVPVFTSTTQKFRVTVDTGYQIMSVSKSGAQYAGSLDSCAGFIGPGACMASATFTPSSPANATGEVDIEECPVAGGTCSSIPVTLDGNGVLIGSATPSAINFGDVPVNTKSAAQTITLTVDSGYTFNFEPPVAQTGFIYVGGTCPFNPLMPFNGPMGPLTCTIEVEFAPAAPGAAMENFNFADECLVEFVGPCLGLSVTLTGNGI